MYAVIESATDRRAPKSSTRIELDRFMDRADALAYIEALVIAGRYGCDTSGAWIEHVGGALDPIGRYRIARDGRAFIQVGRLCIWGRRSETEASLRARKDEQIEAVA